MNIDRLRKILAYSKKNRDEINSKIKIFCSFAGIEYDIDLLNIFQIVRNSFRRKGYLTLEMPFDDDEIGALCYRGDGLGYVVINTSLPRVNANFAIAHEIYHVFFQKSEFVSKVEFSDDSSYEYEEEYAANLFAGMLLMPEVSFRRLYGTFQKESRGDELETILRLMSYYEVPYMAVLIRCLELNLISGNFAVEKLLDIGRLKVRQMLADLWLDESIMDASGRDDYSHIEQLVEKTGRQYMEEGYINEHTVKKALENMRGLYEKIRG